MKVLFLFGGMPHYLVNLLNKIVAKGHKVTVVQPNEKGKTIGKGVAETNKNRDFKTIYLQEYTTILRKQYFKNLCQVVKDEKPEIIVVGWPYIVNLIFDLKLLRLIKKNHISVFYREIPFMVAPKDQFVSYYKKNPIIDEELNNITPKGLSFYVWAFSLLLLRKRIYRLVDGSLCYSSIAKEIQSSYGMDKNNIFITFNSPDTDSILKIKKEIISTGEKIDYNPFRLIHVGRLVKWKKVDLLIDILPDLIEKFPKIELVVIGSGPEDQRLKKLAQKRKIEDYVKFLGSIYDYKNLGTQFLRSGVYVLAGMGGLSINEAMAFGKPVVCSVCDGTEKDLVKEGVNGLFFKHDNKESLLNSIEELFKNPETLKRMGENSEKIIHEKINLETVSDNFINAFKTVYANKNLIN